MKKIYFSVLFIYACILGQAQYSMTNFHNVAPGDISISIPVTDTMAQEGPGGANQTWNFSNLNLGTAASASYVSPSGTPYAASYPNATAATSNGGQYGYLKCNATSYAIEGAAQSSSTVIYSNDQLFLTYPFTYNSVVNDNFSGTIISGTNGTLTGSTTTTGDGYGTLMLPGATLNNVLRVKSSYTRTDNFGAYSIDYYSESYIWYSAASKYPLLNINRFATIFFGTPTWVKTVSVDASAVGISEIKDEKAFTMFPNPSSGDVFLHVQPALLTGEAILEIIDVLGKTVYAAPLSAISQPGQELYSFSTMGLEKGIYSVRINSGKNSTVQKLVLQ
jgi:hypothetical protein